MMTRSLVSLRAQASRLGALLKKHLSGRLDIGFRPGVSRVGGGAFPEADLPTALVTLSPLEATGLSVEGLRTALLATDPPLVGRVEEGTLCLDPRTLAMDEHPLVLAALRQALGEI
jgi:L-seryl-tRNA(Ser) seleniumtransferase